MRKNILIAIFMTVVFHCNVWAATETEKHWNCNPYLYADNLTMIGVVEFDGAEQGNAALEVGAFCGTECRGSELLRYFSQVDRYLLFMTVYGEDDDAITFKLYDHSTGEELDAEIEGIVFRNNAIHGSPVDPYEFNFIPYYTATGSANPVDAGTVTGGGRYLAHETVTLTASPNTGFSFLNWTDGGEVVGTETSIQFEIVGNRTLVANFEMIMHHVSVSANISAAGTVSGGGDYQEGAYATVSAMPNTGFNFVRWTENGANVSTNPNYTFVVWAPRDLVAEFELQITDTIAYTCDAFDWHGHTYTSNGIYYDTLTSYLGIDSIVALHLTFYPSYHLEFTETECGNYFWEDTLYTESGDYTREYRSIYGCDSTLTLHLTILPIRPLGNFTYMSPANNYIVKRTDMDFYWSAVANASSYDFYFWEGDGGRPETPMLSNTNSFTYRVNNLSHDGVYHWCVVAKNECDEEESEVRTFTCQLDPMMTVVPRGTIDFGEVELGQSNTKAISVSGVALTENISYAFLDNAWGQDAPFFQVTPSNWSPTEGGMLHVTFEPEPTQLYYNAAIRIASGTFADTVYFMGSVANRYVFTTEVDGEVYAANDNIEIHGHVEDVLGNAVPDLGVTVYMTVMGSRITIPTTSDANGDYSVTYVPRYSESGFYQVGSCLYGDYTTVAHDAFDIPGLSRVSSDFIIWTPYQDETVTGEIEIRNRSRIPVSGIQVNTVSLPSGCSVNISGVTELGPLETGLLQYTVTGSEVSAGNSYEEAVFNVTSAEGVSMNLTCYYYCRPRRGALEVYPPSVATTMQRNTQKVFSFQIANNGNGETGPITIGLPNVDWMSVMGETTLPSLQVGDSCAFTILLSPGSNMDLTQYSSNFVVNCANGNGVSIPYQLMVTADTATRVVVDVTDDYTYNTNNGNGPHLAGAHVSLMGYYSLENIAEGMTDENGLFVVDDVPEGYYYLSIYAESHDSYNGIIYVDPGQSTRESRQEVYLQFKAIDYSWVVVPTEIEDEYTFELVADIQTNVPVPVVVIDAPSVMDTLDYGDTLHYSITVTNYGLVDALDVRLTMPTGIYEYDFYSLFDRIDTLHAKTSIVVPCMLTRTRRDRSLILGYYLVNMFSDMIEEHCSAEYVVLHYWQCNAQRRWDEYVRNVRIPTSYHCDFFDVSDLEDDDGGGGFGDDIPLDNLPIVGHFPGFPFPSWITKVHDAIVDFIHTIHPPVTAPVEDCTPCWKLIPSAILHLGDLVGLPTGALGDDILYARENFQGMSDFAETAASNPGSLLNDNSDQLRDVIWWGVSHALIPITSKVTVAAVAIVANIVMGAMDLMDHLGSCIRFDNPYRDIPSLNLAVDQFELWTNYFKSLYAQTTNIFPEEEWLYEPNVVEFLDNAVMLLDPVTNTLSPQAAQQLMEASGLTAVNDSIVQRFVDRWNRSIQYWDMGIYTLSDLPDGYDDDFIKLDDEIVRPMREAIEAAEAYGFEHVGELFTSSYGVFQEAMVEHEADVCAKISVSFKQRMTMTREAFEGTLKIANGHTTDPMQDIDVNIVIRDMNGVDRTDLFQINVKSLSQITGVDGTGSLDAQTEGTVMFEMIPTIEAAPDTSMYYSFGGSFSFLDPFSGDVMTYPLFPVKLLVNPSPELHVDYFISRNIISDDPLTEDTIEATQPAELAMMIRNVGAGDAKNVFLQSSQPQIVDNQNGLLIQFDMVGSAMNGVERPLGLTDIPFGTIASHTAGIAEWYFTSSLLARVVHSTPHVIHNDSYGNPKLSLVTELHSHDLIHAVRAYGDLEDGINDFLVNETTDMYHVPDMIYFSHGGTAPVSKVMVFSVEGSLTDTNREIQLTITPTSEGWNYACLDDPAEGQREILSCTRDDGQEIPLSNVWITWATMLDEGAPVHENKLHIVDTFGVNQPATYTLVYGEEAALAATQSMELSKGWNWWSSYIEQGNIDGLAMLEDGLGHKGVTIKSQFDFVQNYYPNYGEDVWFGSLEGIVNEQGYMIDVTEDCSLVMSGVRAQPVSHPITIHRDWNWIGYPVVTRQSLASALSGFNASPDDLIKSQYEFSIYYDGFGWFPDDLEMTPGEGYFYYSNADESPILTYNNSRGEALPERSDKRLWKSDVHAFADNISVVAVVAIDSIEQRDEGLELGAFVDGECRGSARLNHFGPLDRYYAMLSISGQDGDKVEFGFINEAKGQGGMASESHIAFERNGIVGSLDAPYIVNFNTMTQEAQEGCMVLFPNPVERNTAFSLEISGEEVLKEVVVVDMLGEEVLRKTGAVNPGAIEGLHVAGIYVVKAITRSGNVYHGRLVVKQ